MIKAYYGRTRAFVRAVALLGVSGYVVIVAVLWYRILPLPEPPVTMAWVRVVIWEVGMLPIGAFLVALHFAPDRFKPSQFHVIVSSAFAFLLATAATFFHALPATLTTIVAMPLAALATSLAFFSILPPSARKAGDSALGALLLEVRKVTWDIWHAETSAHRVVVPSAAGLDSNVVARRADCGVYSGRHGIATFQRTFVGRLSDGGQVARQLHAALTLEGTVVSHTEPWRLYDIGGAEGTVAQGFVDRLHRLGWPLPHEVCCIEPGDFGKEYRSAIEQVAPHANIKVSRKNFPNDVGTLGDPMTRPRTIVLASHSLYMPLALDGDAVTRWFSSGLGPKDYALVILSSATSHHVHLRRALNELWGYRASDTDIWAEAFLSLMLSQQVGEAELLETVIDLTDILESEPALRAWIAYMARLPAEAISEDMLKEARELLVDWSLAAEVLPKCLLETLPTDAGGSRAVLLHRAMAIVLRGQ